ncbi:hypothetical protein AHAS_Ahas16G0196400 [Arachis hypogaea]
METSQVSAIQAQAPPQEEDAPEVESEWEQANYVNNSSRPPYDPNNKTYNLGWKNHLNFGWRNQQSHNQDHNKPYQSNQYNNHNPNHQSGAISNVLERQIQAEKKMDANQEECRSNIRNQGASISKLEAQLGSFSKQIPMPTHTFPSDTMANLRGECNAIILRSGKVVEEASPSQSNHEKEAVKEPENKKEETHIPSSSKPILKPYVPQEPYLQRLRKDGKDSQFSRFLEIFKKLQINIPFVEALEQMPLYAKFLKELMTRKRNWSEKETIVLTEECSAIIQKKLPQKMKDPGSFQIPCIIGDINIEKALCDLGASINLMSLAMMRRMKIEKAKPTRMALQLADRTFKFPYGVVKDLLVKVGEFIFPADFVVLDMEEEANTSIILERPFLATAGTIIHVQKGELILRLHEENMVFNVFKAMSYPKESIGECMMVDTIEKIVQGVLEEEQCEETMKLE